MNEWMDEWMDGRTNGWMDEWMNKWMDEWMLRDGWLFRRNSWRLAVLLSCVYPGRCPTARYLCTYVVPLDMKVCVDLPPRLCDPPVGVAQMSCMEHHIYTEYTLCYFILWFCVDLASKKNGMASHTHQYVHIYILRNSNTGNFFMYTQSIRLTRPYQIPGIISTYCITSYIYLYIYTQSFTWPAFSNNGPLSDSTRRLYSSISHEVCSALVFSGQPDPLLIVSTSHFLLWASSGCRPPRACRLILYLDTLYMYIHFVICTKQFRISTSQTFQISVQQFFMGSRHASSPKKKNEKKWKKHENINFHNQPQPTTSKAVFYSKRA